MSEIELPIHHPGAAPTHLAVRFDEPAAGATLAVLYFHGFGSDQSGTKASFFRRAAVGEGLAFCSLDFEGHGRSGGDLAGLSLSRNLADARAVHRWLAGRGYRRVIVVGSSMGGITGLWYSALHPAEVGAAMHIAPGVRMAQGFLDFVGEEGARRWRQQGVFHFASEVVDCDLGWGFIEDFAAHPLDRLAQTLTTPTLLLQGKNDEYVPWRAVADFTAACRSEAVELHLFADGDHRLADRLERVWALMREFLAGRGVLSVPPAGA